MATPIDIRADHLRIVQDVLRRHLPDGVKVWVFGSRATWATKDSSDLDLALEGNGEIPARSLTALESAFEDSDLPYAVDVVDVNRIGRRFRRTVEQQRAGLPQNDGRRSADRRNGPPVHWPDTWCRKMIEDIAASSPNAIVGGPFGSNLVSRDYVRDGVPVIRGQNMGARWVTGDFVFVTPEKADSLKVNLARPGDVVLTQRGTLGQVSIVPSALPRCLVSQSQMKVTVDHEVADPQFLYYVLSSAEQQAYVRQNAIQTGVPHTNLEILRSTPIPVPPLTEQRAIAHVLGTLDDRIELNRRMNATLEAMVRALFRSWFVDFDPVRAKMAGRATGLPEEIADVFPDRLVDSGLGEVQRDVPDGWRASTLADVARLNPESWSNHNAPARVLYVDLAKTKWGDIDEIQVHCWADAPSRARRVLRRGDTIVGTVRPGNGSFALIDRDDLTGSTGFAVLRPTDPVTREIVWCAATSHDAIDRLAHLADGGAYPAVKPMAVLDTPVVLPDVPDASVRMAFSSLTAPLLDRLQANQREARTLGTLRDALLPKLVSGELRVRDAEKHVGAIA